MIADHSKWSNEDLIIDLEESENRLITSWERDFINRIASLVYEGQSLTDGQREKLVEIAKERL